MVSHNKKTTKKNAQKNLKITVKVIDKIPRLITLKNNYEGIFQTELNKKAKNYINEWFYENIYKKENLLMYGAYCNNELCGLAFLEKNKDPYEILENPFELLYLVIKKKYYGQGIATQLLTTIQNNCCDFWLWSILNDKWPSLYDKLLFKAKYCDNIYYSIFKKKISKNLTNPFECLFKNISDENRDDFNTVNNIKFNKLFKKIHQK